MNKKILIGSIIAVAILVGVSFTSVVGYNSVESDVKASPLFNIRTSRAIDEEGKDLNFNYIGMGEESILSIPTRDNRHDLIQKVIDYIIGMDDTRFNKFTRLFVYQAKNEIKDIDNNDIIDALLHIRDNPELLKNQIIEQGKFEPLVSKEPCFTVGTTCDTSSECKWAWFTILLLMIIIILIVDFMDWLSELTSKAWCN